jgi:hypothetical protein
LSSGLRCRAWLGSCRRTGVNKLWEVPRINALSWSREHSYICANRNANHETTNKDPNWTSDFQTVWQAYICAQPSILGTVHQAYVVANWKSQPSTDADTNEYTISSPNVFSISSTISVTDKGTDTNTIGITDDSQPFVSTIRDTILLAYKNTISDTNKGTISGTDISYTFIGTIRDTITVTINDTISGTNNSSPNGGTISSAISDAYIDTNTITIKDTISGTNNSSRNGGTISSAISDAYIDTNTITIKDTISGTNNSSPNGGTISCAISDAHIDTNTITIKDTISGTNNSSRNGGTISSAISDANSNPIKDTISITNSSPNVGTIVDAINDTYTDTVSITDDSYPYLESILKSISVTHANPYSDTIWSAHTTTIRFNYPRAIFDAIWNSSAVISITNERDTYIKPIVKTVSISKHTEANQKTICPYATTILKSISVAYTDTIEKAIIDTILSTIKESEAI